MMHNSLRKAIKWALGMFSGKIRIWKSPRPDNALFNGSNFTYKEK